MGHHPLDAAPRSAGGDEVSNTELHDLSTRILLDYSQNWGQSPASRVKALQAAADYCGINATRTIEQWEGHPKEVEAAVSLREAIHKCWPLGQFEWEVAAIKHVLITHRRPMLERLIAKVTRRKRKEDRR